MSSNNPPAAFRNLWGDSEVRVYYSGIPPLVPNSLSSLEMRALMYRARIEEITLKLTTNNLDIDYSENRSPSPPPKYDGMGKRTNTREQRKKEAFFLERQKLIQKVQRMNPGFRPPPDYRPITIKKYRKIPIPIDKYPDYNFIGLIIGPGGLTQKEMEKKSGAKIAIRGKGSAKDGKGRMGGQIYPGDDEPLHVLVTADTEESLQKGEELVREFLIPVEEGKNDYKREQLKTLARMRGTLRDDHVWKENEINNDSPTNISCSLCGEQSHPTRDCPLKGQPGIHSKIDQDLNEFFDQIGDDSHSTSRRGFTDEELDIPQHRDAFEELMAIISGTPYNPPVQQSNYNAQWNNTLSYGTQHSTNPSPYGPPSTVNPSPYGPPSSF